MCEITNGKIYVTDRDLVCYKVMFERGNILESVCQGYEYIIGREYSISGFGYKYLTDDAVYEAWDKPLSPYAGWRKTYTIYPNLYFGSIYTDLRCTRRGFYSYTYYGNGTMECDFELASKVYGSNPFVERVKCVRCRIPEGSKYVVSDNGEVFISERIVIDGTWSLDV